MKESKGAFNLKEFSQYLGVSEPVGRLLLRRDVHPVPCIRVGRRYVIPIAELERWMREESERQTYHGPTV